MGIWFGWVGLGTGPYVFIHSGDRDVYVAHMTGLGYRNGHEWDSDGWAFNASGVFGSALLMSYRNKYREMDLI